MIQRLFTLVLLTGLTIAFTPNTIWETVTGGVLRDIGTDVVIIDDNIFITGYTQSFGNTGNNTFIGKFTLKGNLVWLNPYDLPGDDIALSITHDTAHNTLWAAGYTVVNDKRKIYVVEIETNGDLVQKLILIDGVAEKIASVEDGLLIAGWHAIDIFTVVPLVLKIDWSGNIQWTITGIEGRAYSICQTEDGFTAVGYKDTETGTLPWVMDQNGVETILRTFSNFNEIYSIQSTEDGYVLCMAAWGDTDISAVIMKTDRNLNELWITTLDDMLYGYDIEVLSDGSIIIGSSDRTLNNGDISLIQLDKNGKEIDRYTTGGYMEDWINNIAVTSNGQCAFTGTTYSYGSSIDCDIYTGMAPFSVLKDPKTSQKNPGNFRESDNKGSGGNGCFIGAIL